MSLWSKIATMVGDIWMDRSLLALWPWPAVILGSRESLMLWSDYRAFGHKLQPGDFLLMQSKPYIGSNAAIGGAFKHLAVYLGAVRGQQEESGGHFIHGVEWLGAEPKRREGNNIHDRAVVHAISDGVVVQDFGEVLMHADYCVAVRPWKTESERMIVIKDALAHAGRPYDFTFNQAGDKAVFCTELGLWACRAAAVIEPEPTLIRTSLFGRRAQVALADNFAAHFKPICCSRSCLSQSFKAQSHMPDRIAMAIEKAWLERTRL